jgi:hypothetical protein
MYMIHYSRSEMLDPPGREACDPYVGRSVCDTFPLERVTVAGRPGIQVGRLSRVLRRRGVCAR